MYFGTSFVYFPREISVPNYQSYSLNHELTRYPLHRTLRLSHIRLCPTLYDPLARVEDDGPGRACARIRRETRRIWERSRISTDEDRREIHEVEK